MHIAGVYNLIYIYCMNFLDILIALLLAWFIYLGFNKGLIASVATLIGLAAGLYFSIRFSDWVGQQLFRNSDLDEGTVALTSFIITFIAVLVATYLLGKFVTNLVRTMRLGWLNKLAGALFGSLKAILILSVLLGFLQKINHNYWLISETTMDESKLYHAIHQVADNIFPRITTFYYDFLEEYFPETSQEEEF